MKNFNWERFKKHKIAVHCDTEEKAKDFLQECDKRGINWIDGESSLSDTYYEDFEEETCYKYSEDEFGKGLVHFYIQYHIKYNYKIIKWEIEENTGGRKMKLLELLEAGKKATNDGMNMDGDTGYLVLEGDKILYYFNGENLGETTLDFKQLTGLYWYEYKEEPKYKTNFDMKEIELYHYNTIFNKTASKVNIGDAFDESILKNFNVFKDRKLAEYIQAKQLLERKLMIFSYLNGADEIDWKNTNEIKYYIEYYCNHYNDKLEIATDYTFDFMEDNLVYFKTKEIAEKALELYRGEIEEVMRIRKELGF